MLSIIRSLPLLLAAACSSSALAAPDIPPLRCEFFHFWDVTPIVTRRVGGKLVTEDASAYQTVNMDNPAPLIIDRQRLQVQFGGQWVRFTPLGTVGLEFYPAEFETNKTAVMPYMLHYRDNQAASLIFTLGNLVSVESGFCNPDPSAPRAPDIVKKETRGAAGRATDPADCVNP